MQINQTSQFMLPSCFDWLCRSRVVLVDRRDKLLGQSQLLYVNYVTLRPTRTTRMHHADQHEYQQTDYG